MTLVKRLRLFAVVFALASTALAAAVVLTAGPPPRSSQAPVAIGGPFRLVTHEGKPLASADLAGQPFAVFFGFTHCPDVCPTTLSDLSGLMKDLGPDADRLRVLFISVDPERDTPDLLATYLESFDPRIVALTGSEEAVAAAAAAYRASYRKVPLDGGAYTMDHTATVYLMDRNGRFFSALDYHEGHEAKLAKLRRLLRGP